MRKNLKKFRQELDLSGPKMAAKLDMDYQAYRRVERGETKVTIEMVEKFNEVFEVDDVLSIFKNEVK